MEMVLALQIWVEGLREQVKRILRNQKFLRLLPLRIIFLVLRALPVKLHRLAMNRPRHPHHRHHPRQGQLILPACGIAMTEVNTTFAS